MCLRKKEEEKHGRTVVDIIITKIKKLIIIILCYQTNLTSLFECELMGRNKPRDGEGAFTVLMDVSLDK